MNYKFLLTAINAKFIHSNPAIYSLRAYAGEPYEKYIELAEYTINHAMQSVLTGIYETKPDAIGISCYIWNIRMVSELLPELRKLLPDMPIWLGGPEVSYDPEEVLNKYPEVTGVMVGEGEATFLELLRYYLGENIPIKSIRGIVYRRDKVQKSSTYGSDAVPENIDEICINEPRELTDLDKLPFLYHDLKPFENRIVYYETSRGCPYQCSYCLSSIDKTVRFRSLSIIKRELQYFLDHRLPQVKFVDRTFNCKREHAVEIWKYLIEHDNGVTNFHFEMEADLISDEEFELLQKARPGLFQMEIGVQTTHERTLAEIRRMAKTDRIREAVTRLQKPHNIHIHLDLIAGLPFEDYARFGRSFNDVYSMRPEQLQLGFLKVLKGSYMQERTEEYGLQYLSSAPYEVLSTKWLSFSEVIRLKRIEEMVELYYNSNQFTHVMPLLEAFFDGAFAMYEKLAEYYGQEGFFTETPSRSYRYQVLLKFIEKTVPQHHADYFKEALTYDVYLRENAKSRPAFAKDQHAKKDQIAAFYKKEAEDRCCLPAYASYDARALYRMTHLEYFLYPVWDTDGMRRLQQGLSAGMEPKDVEYAVLFDYQIRDPLTYCARTVHIDQGVVS